MRNYEALGCLHYVHVDVFASHAYGGNSLPVFIDHPDLDARQMQVVTRELRHFEAIFLTGGGEPGRYSARVFDLIEELPFAGHPLIGAAAALHADRGGDADERLWTFDLPARTVTVVTARTAEGYSGRLDQGRADFLAEFDASDFDVAAFGLHSDDLVGGLPLAVVSTGLRYLIVPVTSGALAKAYIRHDISSCLDAVGAQFAVLLDERSLEIRHWNNDGVVEDVATGSAAGTVGAYRLRYCGAASGQTFTLDQGRFAGRPSRMTVTPHGGGPDVHSVQVGGEVAIVGSGVLDALP